MEKIIPKTVLERLPVYLHHLKSLNGEEIGNISSATIARNLGLGEVQVRKDLAMISGTGRPKVGYDYDKLVSDLEDALGCKTETKVVIVGAGRLGRALLSYEHFDEYGLYVTAGFDCDEEKVGKCGEKQIYHTSELKDYCAENEIKIGVIAVPEKNAQEVADKMIEAGIIAIWNFAPARLTLPEFVKVKNENMAASLAILSVSI